MSSPSSSPLHIAFYCNLMAWPKRTEGGVRQWVLALANGFAARGYAVDVLSEAPDAEFKDEPLLDARVRRIVLGKGLDSVRRLNRYVEAHPGVRIIAGLNYYNLRAALLKRRYGERVHVTIVQHEHLSADAAWRSGLSQKLIGLAVRLLFNSADAVVGCSNGVADDLAAHFGVRRERLSTIYNPAYRDDFIASATQAIDHPWLNARDRPLLLAAGRLHVVKGFDVLLQALQRVRGSVDARLIILGEGKERAALEAQVQALGLQDAVSMPGRKPTIAPWMARADLYVLSSRREGLPTVLIESLASGLPVVSTRCPSGPEEILENGRHGTLVAVGDVEGLAQAILAQLRAPASDDVRQQLRRRAAEFSLDRALDRYLEVFERPARGR